MVPDVVTKSAISDIGTAKKSKLFSEISSLHVKGSFLHS